VAQRGPEFRFGMVLYGGVSLAVYIYGVVVEAQRLLRAAEELNRARRSSEKLEKLSPYARALQAAGISDVKIDLLSGTSAGGINGILLAKALARCSDVEKTKDLWLDGGDIEQLLQPPSLAKPRSLLQSRAFERHLRDGMRRLDEPQRGVEAPPILDLFVSSTSLRGGSRLFVDSLGDSIETLQYRYVIQRKLRTPQRGVSGEDRGYEADDFTAEDNETLVKLARATSALPFAFEPVEIAKEDALLPAGDRGGWFADGGILNNKPFTEAVETIVNRSSDRPVRRWLFSIDPDPKPAAEDDGDGGMPPFDQTVVRSIAAIPRYQSIARDLLALDQHNEKVAAAERTIRAGEEELREAPQPGGLGPGVAAAYESMRRQAWGSEVADRLLDGTVVAGSDGSVGLDTNGVWTAYRLVAEAEFPSEVEDGALHRRRLYYLIKLIGMAVDPDEALGGIKERLWAEFEEISSLLWANLTRDCPELKPGGQIAGAREVAREQIAALRQELPRALEQSQVRVKEILGDAVVRIAARPTPLEQRQDGMQVALENLAPVPVVLAEAAEEFRPRDAMLLAADVYGGLRQRDRIEHAQISPVGGRNAGVPPQSKLAGTTLGHFGGFLDRGWRRNDLMWGRLDGAEALVRGVMKEVDPAAAAPLIDELQQGIVRAERPELLSKEGDWKADLLRYAGGDISEGELNGRRLVSLGLRTAGIVRKMLRTAELESAGGGAGGRVRGFILRNLANLIGFVLALVYLPATALFAKGQLLRRAAIFLALVPFVWGVLTLGLAVLGVVPFDEVALPAFVGIAIYPLFLLLYWALAWVALKAGSFFPRLRLRGRR
jgi:uncharacterized protein DUF3376/patatin-like phospholipase